MDMIEIKKYVDRLFKANRKKSYICDIPIVGGHYVPGLDKKACAALDARRWFYENGPADLQPLPLSYNEREDLKHGGVPHILAWFARSLAGRNYNYPEHPPFCDYASGVMASEHAPDFIKKAHLLKPFPPRPLDGLGPGLYWEPPEEHARTLESWGRCCEREDRVRAAIAAPAA
jgi:hypothetical protein